jgi:hypothetical protein
VRDTACDGHDVYLQVRGSSSSWTTDWGRMTKDTPGGCNTSAEYRGDTWFLTAIDRGQVRICQNDFAWDTCGGATDWFS